MPKDDILTEILKTCEDDIKRLTGQIKEFEDIDKTIKKRKNQLRTSMELLDSIVTDSAVSDTHLRMLVDKIIVSEVNGELKVQITLNGKFRMHIDTYDTSGEIIARDSEIWWFPDWEEKGEKFMLEE